MPLRVRDVWPAGEPTRRGWRVWLAVGLGALAVGLSVVWLAGLSRPSTTPPVSPPSAAPDTRSGPADGATDSTPGGIPVGYAHTRGGAVAAASQYLASITGHERFFDDAARTAELTAVADPEALEELQTTYAQAAEELGAQLGLDSEQPNRLLAHTSPVRYRLTDYTRQEAAVEVWAVLVLGTSGTTAQRPPMASWTTTTVRLRWVEGDWKLVATDATLGPSPATDPAASPASSSAFAELLGATHPYRHAGQP